MQVSSWNEARAEHAKEYGYLGNLHEDLQRSISTIDRTVGLLNGSPRARQLLLLLFSPC